MAAITILLIFFGRSVDFTRATINNGLCVCRSALQKDTLNIVLRFGRFLQELIELIAAVPIESYCEYSAS